MTNEELCGIIILIWIFIYEKSIYISLGRGILT